MRKTMPHRQASACTSRETGRREASTGGLLTRLLPAEVLNARESWITRMQAVRYFVAFRVCKAAESIFGAVTCCSGCFSAYRRAAIMPALPFGSGLLMLIGTVIVEPAGPIWFVGMLSVVTGAKFWTFTTPST